MFALAMTLHTLGAVIWIGGMFFAHMALRPVVNEQLEPPQRLPLMYGILSRFFVWVWLAVIAILISGYWLFFGVFQGQTAIYVHVMQGIGLLMAGLFSYIYFVPFRRMGAALNNGDVPRAGPQLIMIRRIIATNLVLGLIAVILGAAKPF